MSAQSFVAVGGLVCLNLMFLWVAFSVWLVGRYGRALRKEG